MAFDITIVIIVPITPIAINIPPDIIIPTIAKIINTKHTQMEYL